MERNGHNEEEEDEDKNDEVEEDEDEEKDENKDDAKEHWSIGQGDIVNTSAEDVETLVDD